MKAKQRASTFAVHLVRAAVIFNLCLFASHGAARAAEAETPIRIVALGDSLTAGLGLQPADAFPDQLAAALKAKGYVVEIANGGVSGDTTAAGLQRLDWAIGDGVDAVIVELGANDALRGIEPDLTRRMLDQILAKLGERRVEVLLAGMEAPRNWGKEYEAKFATIYPDLAAKHGALLYPFFLDGVALDAALNQPDGLHPTAKGIGVIVERILPKVEELIGRVRAKRVAAGKS
jgi:acyl-CoA thioesterase-1